MIVRKLLFILLICFSFHVQAQDRLVIAGTSGNYYVVHTVQEKESLSSIGRIYGYTAKQLAQYNSLNSNANLPISAKLKIPLTADNFSIQSETNNGIALYHIAQKGDNLFRLSQQYYKVPLALLRTWNDLTTDVVKDGQAIIVGFFAGARINTAKTNDQEIGNNSVTSSIAVNKPVTSDKPPLKNPNVMDAAVDGARTLEGEMKPLTENELLLLGAAQASVKQSSNSLPAASAPNEYSLDDFEMNYSPKPGDEGYFALFYDQSTKSGEKVAKSGDVAIFQSTSGIADHKYYLLMNNVLPGTIVKITAPNKKIIYARVLGSIPENNHSAHTLLYMSNAAAAALGVTKSNAFVSINYYQ
jgi:LysM repeat protein